MHNFEPTKLNLQIAKRSLTLAGQGFNLLDQKQKILQRELHKKKAVERSIAQKIMAALPAAIKKVRHAVEEVGELRFENICSDVCKKGGARLGSEPHYDLHDSTVSVDIAFFSWLEIKKMLLALVTIQMESLEIERQFIKVKKRAAALENILIPRYEAGIKQISAVLEERERDEAIRIRVSKHTNAFAQTGGQPANIP